MKLIRDMSDDAYHEQKSRDEHFYSSSQLKLALENIHEFKRQYIDGEIKETPKALQDAFNVGTVSHTAVLEPHNLEGSFIVYPLKVRSGAKWVEFQEEHKGKIILSQAGHKEYLIAKSGAEQSEVTQDILAAGEAEVSLFGEMNGMRLKVRADWIDFDRGLLGDLKTGGFNTADVAEVKKKIENLSYDLSAALYIDMFQQYYEQNPKKFKKDFAGFKEFFWMFASKKSEMCRCYSALEDLLAVGRAKYKKAIALIKYYEALDWDISEECVDLGASPWEKTKWLQEKSQEQLKQEALDDL